MKLHNLTAELRPAVLYIAENMREWDRREIYATRWDTDPGSLANAAMAGGAFAWVAGLERPIAALGAVPCWPGVWSVWMFATNEFDKIGLSLTKHVKRRMMPALRATGGHRAECRSLEDYQVANAWLEHLGATVEAKLKRYGRNGEDFRLYVWRDVDVL